MLEYKRFKVYWEGHATVRVVDDGFTVAVDPYSEASESFEADIVLITHPDLGHFDPDFVEEVAGNGTCVVIPDSMRPDKIPCRDVEQVEPGDQIDVYGVKIEAVPVGNQLRKHDPGVGYRFRMDDTDFYVAGDTGLLDSFIDLEGKVDLAFLPVEGIYTMDLDDAVKTAARIKPDLVVPYHYGEPFFGDKDVDLKGFKAELQDRNIRCRIMSPEED